MNVSRANNCFFLLQSKGTLQTSLKGHANTIRQIHIQQVIPLEQSMVIYSCLRDARLIHYLLIHEWFY